MSKKVEMTYYISDYAYYVGRVLGLLTEKQFCVLRNHASTVAKKLVTGRTVSLTELADADVKGLRLLFLSRDAAGKAELVVTKPLEDMYNSVYGPVKDDPTDTEIFEVSFLDEDNNWLTLETQT